MTTDSVFFGIFKISGEASSARKCKRLSSQSVELTHQSVSEEQRRSIAQNLATLLVEY